MFNIRSNNNNNFSLPFFEKKDVILLAVSAILVTGALLAIVGLSLPQDASIPPDAFTSLVNKITPAGLYGILGGAIILEVFAFCLWNRSLHSEVEGVVIAKESEAETVIIPKNDSKDPANPTAQISHGSGAFPPKTDQNFFWQAGSHTTPGFSISYSENSKLGEFASDLRNYLQEKLAWEADVALKTAPKECLQAIIKSKIKICKEKYQNFDLYFTRNALGKIEDEIEQAIKAEIKNMHTYAQLIEMITLKINIALTASLDKNWSKVYEKKKAQPGTPSNIPQDLLLLTALTTRHWKKPPEEIFGPIIEQQIAYFLKEIFKDSKDLNALLSENACSFKQNILQELEENLKIDGTLAWLLTLDLSQNTFKPNTSILKMYQAIINEKIISELTQKSKALPNKAQTLLEKPLKDLRIRHKFHRSNFLANQREVIKPVMQDLD